MGESLAKLAEAWLDWMAPLAIQAGALVLLLALLDPLLRRFAWPQLRLAIWMLVPVKLLLSPTLFSPVSFMATISSFSNLTLPPAGDVSGFATSLFAVWIAGTVFVFCFSFWRRRNLKRELKATALEGGMPDWFEPEMRLAANRLGLRRTPRVLRSSRTASAGVFGVFRPTLALPEDFFRTHGRIDARNVLLHELTHLRRRDPLISVALEVLQAAFWFHPFCWLAWRKISTLREIVCDARVAETLREDAPGYRTTLARAAREFLDREENGPALSLRFFSGQSAIRARLEALSRPYATRPLARNAATIAIVLAMSACVLPMAAEAGSIASAQIQAAREIIFGENAANRSCLERHYAAMLLSQHPEAIPDLEETKP